MALSTDGVLTESPSWVWRGVPTDSLTESHQCHWEMEQLYPCYMTWVWKTSKPGYLVCCESCEWIVLDVGYFNIWSCCLLNIFFQRYKENRNNYKRSRKNTRFLSECLLQCLLFDKCVFCGTTNWTLDCTHKNRTKWHRTKKGQKGMRFVIYMLCSGMCMLLSCS